MNEEKLASLISLITYEVCKCFTPEGVTYYDRLIPVGLSNKHVHLSRCDIEQLFGTGYQLTKMKDLLPGQFAAMETVTIVGSKGTFHNIRVLGPEREKSQVEISRSDGFILGINAPVRDSGDLKGTPGLIISGPRGAVNLEEGVICAKRHIHMSPDDAEYYQVRDKDLVSVIVEGEKAVTFHEVLVRVHPSFVLEMHIDLDEGNAAGLNNGNLVALRKKVNNLGG